MENNDTPGEYITPFKFVADHFEKRDLRTLSVDWERKSLFFQMYENQVVLGCSFMVSEDDSRLEIHMQYPFIVANEKYRPSVAELVTRINYGLRIGSFEFDMKDGEVRYHIGHLMENCSISEMLLLRLFNIGMRTADQYFPAFIQHIYSGVTAEDAVYMAELDLHSEAVEETPPSEKKADAVEGKKQPRKRSTKKKLKADPPAVQPLLDDSSGTNSGIQNPQTTPPEGNAGDGGEDESRHAA